MTEQGEIMSGQETSEESSESENEQNQMQRQVSASAQPPAKRGRPRGHFRHLGVRERNLDDDTPPYAKPQFLPDEDDQVENEAGGFVWQVDDMMRLRRFLCLGTAGGTYYVGEKELTLENAQAVVQMLEDGKGLEVVKELETISVEGRAAKQNPTLFCLALCAHYESETCADSAERRAVKRAAFDAFPRICRIPTHVFLFVDYSEKISKHTGWGRAQRRAISDWYLKKEPRDAAMAVTKYPQREGWTHRDLLRLAHPKPIEEKQGIDDVFCYAAKGWKLLQERLAARNAPAGDAKDEEETSTLQLLRAVEELKNTEDPDTAAALIREHGLVREHVPTTLLNQKQVWSALLEKMPLTALIRNLNKMTLVELLEPRSDHHKSVLKRLRSAEALKKARIHPFNVLLAHRTYKKGKGDKGKLKWTPEPGVLAALEDAFYLSFKNVEPTGKSFCIALDVSGSMDFNSVQGCSMSAREASTAMCLVTIRTEPHCEVVAFSDYITPVPLDKEVTLDGAIQITQGLDFSATDCSLPMLWALHERKSFDVFMVFTDNETWAGNVHPYRALREYRRVMEKPEARLVVVGMTATKFTIADPRDPGMLDVAGFDSAAPQIIADFVNGKI